MNTAAKDKLIEEITNAFSGTEFPGDENLVAKSYGEEPELIRKHFSGQNNWNELMPGFLDHDGALSFFSDEAFRFYLPAFMIADINEHLSFNDPSVRLCWSVTPQSEDKKLAAVFGGGTLGERARECFRHFSAEQVKVIVAYLLWKQEQYDDYCVKQALKNYWLKRTDNRKDY
ncbi:MAG: DUF6714 family protein [Bacteroidia bacterium]|jgi:hypothetical protein